MLSLNARSSICFLMLIFFISLLLTVSKILSVVWSLQLRIQLFYCMNTILWESEGRMTFSLRQSYLVMSLDKIEFPNFIHRQNRCTLTWGLKPIIVQEHVTSKPVFFKDDSRFSLSHGWIIL